MTDSYLEVLDRALIDRILALHEIDELIGLAKDLGLSQEQTEVVHCDYLAALARQAYADGELTDAEIADLLVVADLLDLGDEEGAGRASGRGEGEREGGGRAFAAARPSAPSLWSPGTASSSRARYQGQPGGADPDRPRRWACGP